MCTTDARHMIATPVALHPHFALRAGARHRTRGEPLVNAAFVEVVLAREHANLVGLVVSTQADRTLQHHV